jgi:phosphatidylinositol alpha-1,6-mannosyltransferase
LTRTRGRRIEAAAYRGSRAPRLILPAPAEDEPIRASPSSILLGLTGLNIDGGIAVVSRCIARALDEETRAGRIARVDRVLLLDEPDRAPAAPSGEQRLARGRYARFIWQIWRSFWRRRHDLVLFDLVGLGRSVALPLPGFPPPKIAIFVHGIELLMSRDGPRAQALRKAHLLLTNSRFTADWLRRELPEVSDRIRVVPLCIDPERIALWTSAASPEDPPARERAAVIVGRMWAEERGKGHDELIAAWPAVRREVPDAELWIVGTGDDIGRLRAKASELGVADRVRFFGRVPDAELGALYQRASLFAMPSRQEGFGVVYAEAMWWGLPCIGSTADAAGQVIAAGETGELVPYGDVAAIARAVAGLLSDPVRAARMGEAGRRHARDRFGYDRFRSDLLAALDLPPRRADVD